MIFHEIKVHYDRQTGEDNPGNEFTFVITASTPSILC